MTRKLHAKLLLLCQFIKLQYRDREKYGDFVLFTPKKCLVLIFFCVNIFSTILNQQLLTHLTHPGGNQRELARAKAAKVSSLIKFYWISATSSYSSNQSLVSLVEERSWSRKERRWSNTSTEKREVNICIKLDWCRWSMRARERVWENVIWLIRDYSSQIFQGRCSIGSESSKEARWRRRRRQVGQSVISQQKRKENSTRKQQIAHIFTHGTRNC